MNQNLLERWKPVLDKVQTARFGWVTRPWLPEKIEFIAQACEAAHNSIQSEMPHQFLSSAECSAKFSEMINNKIREWDEMDPSEDFEAQRIAIINELFAEIDYANEKWGVEFDDENTLNDWVTYICMYATDAAKMTAPPKEQRKQLVKCAGLALSALIALDRNGGFRDRHYEAGVAKD